VKPYKGIFLIKKKLVGAPSKHGLHVGFGRAILEVYKISVV
jgi:hypothetical protein